MVKSAMTRNVDFDTISDSLNPVALKGCFCTNNIYDKKRNT